MKIKTRAIVVSAIVAAVVSNSAVAGSARHHKGHSLHSDARPTVAASTLSIATFFNRASGNDLVAQARKYIGTNPTGMKRLWCGAFMDLVLRQTGHKGGSNSALDYLRYGTRVPGPKVGAIAVMGRRGGGHVGVVSGVDANGNPIIISGNHKHTTAESVYPRGRIYAYVVPNS